MSRELCPEQAQGSQTALQSQCPAPWQAALVTPMGRSSQVWRAWAVSRCSGKETNPRGEATGAGPALRPTQSQPPRFPPPPSSEGSVLNRDFQRM